MTVRIRGIVHQAVEELTAGILLRDRLGHDIFGTNTFYHDSNSQHPVAGEAFQAQTRRPCGTQLRLVGPELGFAVTPAHRASSFVGVCNLPVRVVWANSLMDQ